MLQRVFVPRRGRLSMCYPLGLCLLLAACGGAESQGDGAASSATPVAVSSAAGSGVPLAEVQVDYDALGARSIGADVVDPVLEAMGAELERSRGAYFSAAEPAYFLAYRLFDNRHLRLVAESGSLRDVGDGLSRTLNVELRTGDHRRDSTHPIRTDGFNFGFLTGANSTHLALSQDQALLRDQIWKATDAAYWQAVEEIAKVRANVAVKVDEEDDSDSFSRDTPTRVLEAVQPLTLDRMLWSSRLKTASARLGADPRVLGSRVSLSAEDTVMRLVTSDGGQVRTAAPVYRLDVSAIVKAEDGMELVRSRRFLVRDPGELPDAAALDAAVDGLLDELFALREAPLATAYEGPAIIEGEAAGVFFHEVLGHRVEGDRLRREEDQQTFKNKLGERVLPPGFRVSFDPTRAQFEGQALHGGYAVDAEGIAAQAVDVIDDGILRGFLLSRRPIEGFPQSNGHGRAAAGYPPVARQSNLLVSQDGALSREELKQRLLEQVQAQGKPWGLLIRSIDAGGYTVVGRADISSFKVNPEMVYRVYPDGREELVRGVDLIGTPLTLFAEVEAAADDAQIFHGWCGAESGMVPTSTVAPSILLRRVEVQRKPRSQDRPPLLPAPETGA